MKWLADLVMPTWAKVLIPILIVAAIYGCLNWVYSSIYNKGVQHERGLWELKQAKLAQEASDTIMQLKDEKRAVERARVIDAANITNLMRTRIKSDETKANTTLAAVRAGTISLRIPTVFAPTSCTSGIGGASATGPRDDGTRRAELSGQASEFLIGEGRRANRIVEKLTACQEQHLSDRKKLEELYASIRATQSIKIKD